MEITHIVFLKTKNLNSQEKTFVFACGGKNGMTNSNLSNILKFIDEANTKLNAGISTEYKKIEVIKYNEECHILGVEPIHDENTVITC